MKVGLNVRKKYYVSKLDLVHANLSQTNKLKLDLNNGGFGGLFGIGPRFSFFHMSKV